MFLMYAYMESHIKFSSLLSMIPKMLVSEGIFIMTLTFDLKGQGHKMFLIVDYMEVYIKIIIVWSTDQEIYGSKFIFTMTLGFD